MKFHKVISRYGTFWLLSNQMQNTCWSQTRCECCGMTGEELVEVKQ